MNFRFIRSVNRVKTNRALPNSEQKKKKYIDARTKNL